MTRARDTADILTLAPDSQGLESAVTHPLIINGDMRITQRMDSDATRDGLNISSSGMYTHDRWYMDLTNAGAVDTTADTDVPSGQGFQKSLKIKCRTADGSLAAGDVLSFKQIIEDQRCVITRKGHSDAKKLTVSFWIKSGVTGTYICELYDYQNSRQISQAYTVSSADTWEKKVLVFDGDTTGKFAGDNGQGLGVIFWLAAGSTYTGGSLSTSWGSITNNTRAAGQVNFQGTADKLLYLTGVQLEIGEYTATTIPPFQHLSYGDELLRCLRYFEVIGGGLGGSGANFLGIGGQYTGSHFDTTLTMKAEKRTTPTIITTDTSSHYIIGSNDASNTIATITGISSRAWYKKVNVYFSGTITHGAQGYAGFLACNHANAFLQVSSEL